MPISNVGRRKLTATKFQYCDHGHELRPENVYETAGKTYCRLCMITTSRRHYRPTNRVKPSHCPKGHPYTEANSAYSASKHTLYCRECHKLRERKRRQRKRFAMTRIAVSQFTH